MAKKTDKKEEEKEQKKRNFNPFLDFRPEITNKKTQSMMEALSVANRRKLAQRMIRTARKLAVARKKARVKFAPDKNLKIRAQRLARSIMRKRSAGKRGQQYRKLGMADKVAIDKMIEKGAGKAITKKLTRILRPAVKRAEADRLRGELVGVKDGKNDPRHKKKLHGRKQR